VNDLSGTVRYAFRLLRRSPGFSLAAVLVLGIGVGAVCLIGVVALIACRVPAVRAARTDPTEAMRAERPT